MELNELIEVMKKAMDRYDLSDEYLKSVGSETREYYAFGEYHYGITTIPCSMVYPYLIELEKMKKENNDTVKHGKWEIDSDFFPVCSNCKYKPLEAMTRYCPNCGARMDGDKDGTKTD